MEQRVQIAKLTIKNPKSEFSNVQNKMEILITQIHCLLVLNFVLWSFGFVSCFGFRISNLILKISSDL
jgi:hypothetical protein